MKVILQAQFDSKTNNFVKALWNQTEEAGLPNPFLARDASPSITLISADEVELESLTNTLNSILDSQAPIKITFATLSTFANENGVILLSPIVTIELLQLQKNIFEEVSMHSKPIHPYYHTNNWYPHCTINMRLENTEVFEGLKLFKDLYLPFEGQIKNVYLFDFATREVLTNWVLE